VTKPGPAFLWFRAVAFAALALLILLPLAQTILRSFMATLPHEGVAQGDTGIGVAAFFCFIFSWVEFVFARILTVTGGKPMTMAINALFTFQTDTGLVMAMTVFSLLPGLAMIWFVRNHISRGFEIRT